RLLRRPPFPYATLFRSRGGLADIGQAVWCFDHLPRPPMREVDAGHDRGERGGQTLVARVGVGRLSRLVILAAENHHVVIAMRFKDRKSTRLNSSHDQTS